MPSVDRLGVLMPTSQVKIVIGAIWPSFYNLHNTLPESTGIELVSSLSKLRHLLK